MPRAWIPRTCAVEPGDTSVMLMALKNGVDRRVHLEAIDGVMADYKLSLEDEEFVLEHDFIHTDLFGNCLRHLPAWHAAGKTVVMDFSVFSRDPEYRCEELFPYVDYAFMSFEEDADLRSWLEGAGARTARSPSRRWARRGALPTTASASMSAGSSRRRAS